MSLKGTILSSGPENGRRSIVWCFLSTPRPGDSGNEWRCFSGTTDPCRPCHIEGEQGTASATETAARQLTILARCHQRSNIQYTCPLSAQLTRRGFYSTVYTQNSEVKFGRCHRKTPLFPVYTVFLRIKVSNKEPQMSMPPPQAAGVPSKQLTSMRVMPQPPPRFTQSCANLRRVKTAQAPSSETSTFREKYDEMVRLNKQLKEELDEVQKTINMKTIKLNKQMKKWVSFSLTYCSTDFIRVVKKGYYKFWKHSSYEKTHRTLAS